MSLNRFAFICGIALALGAGPATAEVIYDSLWIYDEGYMDAGVGNAIGGLNGPLREVTDSQIAEDFVVEQPSKLTRAVMDLNAYNDTIPAEGIWVQFYRDNDGKPHEDVAFDYVVTRDHFEATEIPTPLRYKGWRIDMDLTGSGIELDEGTWWVNFQPLDIETNGDWFWFIASISQPPIGHPSHVRDGWQDHGNQYRGLWNTTDWVPHSFRGNAVLSWRLEGTGGDCTSREKLKARCKAASCGNRVVAKLKKGMPGAAVTFLLDGENPTPAQVDGKGRTKVKWCPVDPGSHTVELSECGVTAETTCP
ncbi:MAG: hypothetical protein C4547_16540 [Phycisphaerales bacterium]|nr:MAG: hypothetical protein C4547_16540 [Phycisphaerales bacterium]